MVSSSNAQKTHLGRSLNRFAEKKVLEALDLTGRALPCSVVSVSGQIVVVKFLLQNIPFTLPNVTCPVATSQYVRLPIQAGELGVVMSADVFIGNVTGLGSGVPDLSPVANLSALVFFPVGNKTWSQSEDANAIVLYGPDGGILRSSDKTATLKVTKAESSWTPASGQPVVINANLLVKGNVMLQGDIVDENGNVYAGNIRTKGEITGHVNAGPVSLTTHTHTQPNDSHGDTEQPTASPTAGT